MHPQILIAISNPVAADREEEFNDWYDNVHVPEILEMPGFRKAARFRVVGQTLPSEQPPVYTYVAMYEVDDAVEAVRTTSRHMSRFRLTTAFDFPGSLGFALELLSVQTDEGIKKIEI
jgi:Domain of unknown function (DUF4286)